MHLCRSQTCPGNLLAAVGNFSAGPFGPSPVGVSSISTGGEQRTTDIKVGSGSTPIKVAAHLLRWFTDQGALGASSQGCTANILAVGPGACGSAIHSLGRLQQLLTKDHPSKCVTFQPELVSVELASRDSAGEPDSTFAYRLAVSIRSSGDWPEAALTEISTANSSDDKPCRIKPLPDLEEEVKRLKWHAIKANDMGHPAFFKIKAKTVQRGEAARRFIKAVCYARSVTMKRTSEPRDLRCTLFISSEKYPVPAGAVVAQEATTGQQPSEYTMPIYHMTVMSCDSSA